MILCVSHGTFDTSPTPGTTNRLVESLSRARRASSAEPIIGPDQSGAFPEVGLLARPLPVVIDANWLRNDIWHSVRHDRQTIMVTAANVGSLRLYCAPHVIDEVVEHHGDWAEGRGVTPDDFLARFREWYEPLFRVVDPPLGVLTPTESRRIEELRFVDPDDVPSAALALLIQGAFISGDRQASRAVYGGSATAKSQAELLKLLTILSNSVELESAISGMVAIPALAIAGLGQFLNRLVRTAHPGLLAAGGVVLALGTTSRPVRALLRGMTEAVAEIGIELAEPYGDLRRHASAAKPLAPPSSELATELSLEDAVLRSCIHALARQRETASAAELAAQLRGIRAYDAGKVRRVLRAHSQTVFHETSRGRWQLGKASPNLGQH
jgi:hypothetical protein